MKTISSIFLTALLLACQITFAQRSVEVKKTNSDGSWQVGNLYDGSYALVIGNSEYSMGWKRLGGVKSDVVAVRDVLQRHGFEVEIEENLTSDRFEPRIKKFINDHGFERNNRLIIYYAGHGHTLNSVGDKRDLGYIISADTPLPDKDPLGFRRKAVSMYAIQTFAKEIQAKHAMFVFDSCFSGKLFTQRDTDKIPPFIVEKIDHPVRQFITAGDETQTVPDESIFRKAFVRGLEGDADRNGDGYIVGTELAEYLKEAVTNYSDRHQTPQYGLINDIDLDRGDFVFAVPGPNSLSPAALAWEKFKPMVRSFLKYDFVAGLNEGIAPVRSGNKWGYVDLSNNLIASIKYDKAYSFSEGMGVITLQEKWGSVNRAGKEIVAPKYEQMMKFSEGLSAVKLNGKWGLIDKNGKVVIPIIYEDAGSPSDGLIAAEQNGKYGYIDSAQKTVISFKHELAYDFSEGLATVSSDPVDFEFIDKTGRVLISSNYSCTSKFSEGFVEVGVESDMESVGENGFRIICKWGFIDAKGKKITDFIYDETDAFSEGLAVVVKDKKQGFIDKNGVEIIPLKYDVDECDCGRSSFSGGLAQVILNKKLGFINKTGKEVVPLKYDSVWCYAFKNEGFIGVTLNGKKGFVDLYGNEYFDF